MAPGFIEGFARWLDRKLPIAVRLAGEGDRATRGIWFAPDGAHLTLTHSMRFAFDSEHRGAPPALDRRAAGEPGAELRARRPSASCSPAWASDGAAGAAAIQPRGGHRDRPGRGVLGRLRDAPGGGRGRSRSRPSRRRRSPPPCARCGRLGGPRERSAGQRRGAGRARERHPGRRSPRLGALAAAIGRVSPGMDAGRFLAALDDPGPAPGAAGPPDRRGGDPGDLLHAGAARAGGGRLASAPGRGPRPRSGRGECLGLGLRLRRGGLLGRDAGGRGLRPRAGRRFRSSPPTSPRGRFARAEEAAYSERSTRDLERGAARPLLDPEGAAEQPAGEQLRSLVRFAAAQPRRRPGAARRRGSLRPRSSAATC